MCLRELRGLGWIGSAAGMCLVCIWYLVLDSWLLVGLFERRLEVW